MNISQESAKESLNAVQDTITQTRKAISASYAADILILWGLILIAGFTGCHFYPNYGGQIFTSLDVIGFIGTFWFIRKGWKKGPVKSTAVACGKIGWGWKIFGFWTFLGIYFTVLLFILQPTDGRQISASILITCMLAYIVIGLWFDSYFMIWLAITVTAMTVTGFHFLYDYFYLWMAPTGGGAILGTGLYIRFAWK